MAGSEGMEVESEQQMTGTTENEEAVRQDSEQTESQQEEETEQQQEKENQPQAAEQNDRLLKLPLSRIKTIIKMDPDVSLASQEAVVTLTKAAELFISAVSKDASYKTLQAKRKTLLRKDLEHIFDTRECYAFLEGTMES
ncbi:DNA polymerase epsilon subunit 4-like [Littorina saxatilis]|uniref:Transcription factor CBF/NF-Y/archaeal histone domain-containing protein n=1 Tax=Littorina saxatilis TaxID=31220 RepID=A0AAN9B6Q2_9CAEN